MKKIEALIRPFELDEVKENLGKIGIHSITVTDVRASQGEHEEDPEQYLGENYAGYAVEFLPKVKIEVIVAADKVTKVADAILKSSRTSEKSKSTKGRVLVYDIAQVI